jgi:hypothetical protein
MRVSTRAHTSAISLTVPLTGSTMAITFLAAAGGALVIDDVVPVPLTTLTPAVEPIDAPRVCSTRARQIAR